MSISTPFQGFPGGSDGKQYGCNVRDLGSIPGSGRSPGEWIPTPVFLPEKPHGHRSLAGYSPQGRKESDTTEPQTHLKVAVTVNGYKMAAFLHSPIFFSLVISFLLLFSG